MWTVSLSPQTTTGDPALERRLEAHRRELTAHCYRMLGSGFEAEDAVQETMVRAWKSIDRLDDRAALRAWMYRIATNVCLDMLQGAQRRARPMDLNSPVAADGQLDGGLPESAWIQPVADARVLPPETDPAELAAAKESVRLAFVAALQHLPPRQRVVLILREVLRWQATEVAALLDTTVASVNSALQRARATLDGMDIDLEDASASAAADEQDELLDKYVDAFERYDISSLVSLLHDDAVFNMPPYEFWIQGPQAVHDFMYGHGIVCEGSRTIKVQANGMPAFASYHAAGEGVWKPWSIVVLDVRDGRIAEVSNFLYPELFEAFGLPPELTL
jgi:RNA polymerase sigma-70 factor (ECF subfamily)